MEANLDQQDPSPNPSQSPSPSPSLNQVVMMVAKEVVNQVALSKVIPPMYQVNIFVDVTFDVIVSY